MAVDLGSLFVELKIDTIDYQTGMEKAKQQTTSLNVSTRQLGRNLFQFGAILSAFGGGVLLLLKKMAETAAEAMGDTSFQEATLALDEAIQSLSITIGEIILPLIVENINRLAEWIDKINELDPNILRTVVTLLFFAASIAAVLGPIAIFLGVILKIVAAFATFGGWLAPIGTALAGLGAGPIVLLIAGLLLLWTAWEKNWGNIREHLDSVIAGIISVFSGFVGILTGLWDILMGIIELDGDKIFKGLSKVWEGIVKVGTGLWKILVDGIIGFVIDLVKGVINWFLKLADILGKVWGDIWAAIVKVVSDAIKSALNFILGFVNKIIEVINGLIAGINSISGKLGLGKIGLMEKISAESLIPGGAPAAAPVAAAASATTVTINFNDAFIDSEERMGDLTKRISDIMARDVKSQTVYTR